MLQFHVILEIVGDRLMPEYFVSGVYDPSFSPLLKQLEQSIETTVLADIDTRVNWTSLVNSEGYVYCYFELTFNTTVMVKLHKSRFSDFSDFLARTINAALEKISHGVLLRIERIREYVYYILP